MQFSSHYCGSGRPGCRYDFIKTLIFLQNVRRKIRDGMVRFAIWVYQTKKLQIFDFYTDVFS